MPERKVRLPKAVIGGAAIIVGFTGTGVGLWGIGQSINEKSILVKDYPAQYEVNSAEKQVNITLQELLQADGAIWQPSALQRGTLTRAQEVITRYEQKQRIMQSEPYHAADLKYIAGVFSMLLGLSSGLEGLVLLQRKR